MRIISGIYKSRILKSPVSDKVRPTSDRAKEMLFNVLNNRINFYGKTCMDIFCGSGSLGLECISRGAVFCYFVDKDLQSVKKNIALLKADEKCKLIKSDAVDFLKSGGMDNIDLIFCDPPYDYKKYDELISAASVFKSLVVLEHSDKFVPYKEFEKNIFLKRKAGTVNFTFFDFKKLTA